jgi:hypothetical protein
VTKIKGEREGGGKRRRREEDNRKQTEKLKE